jgi:hypothetical protein
MPVNAALAGQPPATKIRAQGPDVAAVATTPLIMPSPEALGLAPPRSASIPAPPAELDWNDLRQRLRQLGAVGFHLDQIAGGNWRATLLLPGAGAASTRQLEALADSEAAAVSGVLARAAGR